MTGVGAVVNTAKVRPGDSVVVIGCGGVAASRRSRAPGLAAGAHRGRRHRAGQARRARRFGATHAVTPDRLSDLATEITGGEGFDTPSTWSPVPQTLRTAWTAGATRRHARGGRAAGPSTRSRFNPFELLFEGKRIIPSLYGSAYPPVTSPAHRAVAGRAGSDLEGMVLAPDPARADRRRSRPRSAGAT
jgi:S-(hydroxymethyl)glutathione dehydrogenase/alcohol dehydrogenase